MKQCLEKLREEGISLAILSSNNEETIRAFLTDHDLAYFDAVKGKISLFDKARFIRRFLRKMDIPAESALYVGDEIRDVEAAKKAGIPVIAVGWGYDEASLLASAHPDEFVQRPDELTETILRRHDTR